MLYIKYTTKFCNSYNISQPIISCVCHLYYNFPQPIA